MQIIERADSIRPYDVIRRFLHFGFAFGRNDRKVTIPGKLGCVTIGRNGSCEIVRGHLPADKSEFVSVTIPGKSGCVTL